MKREYRVVHITPAAPGTEALVAMPFTGAERSADDFAVTVLPVLAYEVRHYGDDESGRTTTVPVFPWGNSNRYREHFVHLDGDRWFHTVWGIMSKADAADNLLSAAASRLKVMHQFPGTEVIEID